MINKNDKKRIITNEDLFNHISDFKLEMKITKEDLYSAILRLERSLEDLRKSTLEGFDMVFKTIDNTNSELREELKNDNIILRKEMNQRFTIVDNKLSHIEDNMTYKHQLSSKFA